MEVPPTLRSFERLKSPFGTGIESCLAGLEVPPTLRSFGRPRSLGLELNLLVIYFFAVSKT